jgi:hypothetical protein
MVTVASTDDLAWLPFQGAWGEGEFVRWKAKDGSLHRHADGTSPKGPAQKGRDWNASCKRTP